MHGGAAWQSWRYKKKSAQSSTCVQKFEYCRIVGGSCHILHLLTWHTYPFLYFLQVKLIRDVSMTPETEVSSTVATNSNNSNDSDQSDEAYSVKIEPSVIPHTAIVCMPTMATMPSPQHQHLQSSSYSNSSSMSPSGALQQPKLTQTQFQSSQFHYSDIDSATKKSNNNRILSQPIQFSQTNQIAQQLQQRHQVMWQRRSNTYRFSPALKSISIAEDAIDASSVAAAIGGIGSCCCTSRKPSRNYTNELASNVCCIERETAQNTGQRWSRQSIK